MIIVTVIVILLIALGGMWALASYESAHAQAMQAQALITANQTAQISVIGQTILSLALVVLVLAILVGIVLALMMFKRSQTQAAQNGHTWAAGPNARWQKSGQRPEQPNLALETSRQALFLQQQMMQQQLVMMWLMSQVNKSPEVISLPEPQHLEVGNDLPWWE